MSPRSSCSLKTSSGQLECRKAPLTRETGAVGSRVRTGRVLILWWLDTGSSMHTQSKEGNGSSCFDDHDNMTAGISCIFCSIRPLDYGHPENKMTGLESQSDRRFVGRGFWLFRRWWVIALVESTRMLWRSGLQ